MPELKSDAPEDKVISGVMGLYIQTLSPKVKSLAYRYLTFCSNRAKTANLPLSIVTNDATIQGFATRLGIDIEIVWRACDHLWIFSVTEDVLDDEYVTRILDTLNQDCEYEVVECEPKVVDKARKVPLDYVEPDDSADDEEDTGVKMGQPYHIKTYVRDNPNPYPIRHPAPTPVFQPRPDVMSSKDKTTKSVLSSRLSKLVVKRGCPALKSKAETASSNGIVILKVLSSSVQGCIKYNEEVWNLASLGWKDSVTVKAAYNLSGDYVGDWKEAKYLVNEGIRPETISADLHVCTIGFNEKTNKWAGWSHRARNEFGIGDTYHDKGVCVPYDANPESKRIIKTLDEAKESAINFAEDVS